MPSNATLFSGAAKRGSLLDIPPVVHPSLPAGPSTPDLLGLIFPEEPPTPDMFHVEQMRIAAQHTLRQMRAARDNLMPFAELFSREKPYLKGEYNVYLSQVLMQFLGDVEAKLEPVYIVTSPPRVGKSELISRQFPAFVLGRHPDWEVISASATEDLASEFGSFVRQTLGDPMYRDIFPSTITSQDVNNILKVNTTRNGGYRAAGVGNTIVGKGAHVFIVDDPVSGVKKAKSQGERDSLHAWFRNNVTSRLAPGGGIIVMHQRWDTDDLAGRLIEASESETGRPVVVVDFPQEATEHDILGRQPGDILFPERWPRRVIESRKQSLTVLEWEALHQQNPRPDTGGFFEVDDFLWYTALPVSKTEMRWVIGLDMATTKAAHGDHTAIIPVGVAPDGTFFVGRDFVFERLDPLETVEKLYKLTHRYNTRDVCGEKGTIQNLLGSLLRNEMRRRGDSFHLHGITRSSAKHIEAIPYQTRVKNRFIYFPDIPQMRGDVLRTHINFVPDADNKDDDFIDAMANAMHFIEKLPRPRAESPPKKAEVPPPFSMPWIQKHTQRRKTRVPFTRLNGQPYR